MAHHQRPPYSGKSRKLVIAFDLGTTFSGISYALLDPGVVPETKGVTRFPAQEKVGGDSKIPSVLFYDKFGNVCAAGAEAMQEGTIEKAEDEGWTRVEWFKLHLRPREMATSLNSQNLHLPPLPQEKDAIDVIGDFLQYLFECARTYIQESHANGKQMWETVEPSIDFVLSHPNGWRGREQGRLRHAAVAAGLFRDDPSGHARLHFVTEGEACLHFCVQNSLASDAIKVGDGIQIIDAGGGTVDISSYSVESVRSYKESAASQCLLQGSVFVNRRARVYLAELTTGSRYSNEEDLNSMISSFDKTTKPSFRSDSEPSFIRFGSASDRDPRIGIRSGQLKLPGAQVASFFEPSIAAIAQTVHAQQKTAKVAIKTIFLVGGFAASPWLFSELQRHLKGLGLNFSRPDSHLNKAVADGAVSFYLDRLVSERVSSASYGICSGYLFDWFEPAHKARSHLAYTSVDGKKRILFYSEILAAGVQVASTKEFRESYIYESEDQVDELSQTILQLQGEKSGWLVVAEHPDRFSTLCTIRLKNTLPKGEVCFSLSTGKYYYVYSYDVVLSFGLTELKAEISWLENGMEKRSPAFITYPE